MEPTPKDPQTIRREMAAELRKDAHKDRANAAYTLEIEKTIDQAREENAQKITAREKELEQANQHAAEEGISKGERKRRKADAHAKEQMLKGLRAREESWKKKKGQSREQARQLLTRAEAYEDKAAYLESISDADIKSAEETIRQPHEGEEGSAHEQSGQVDEKLQANNEEQDHGKEKE